MSILVLSRYALSVTAAALLAGCGGSQSPIGAPGAMPQSRPIPTRAQRGESWMLPEANKDDLLYLTVYKSIDVYSYPAGKLVGMIKAYGYPIYECSDSKGDVFVASGYGSDQGVYEYAHGGSEPIQHFPVGAAYGCAVDPTTGDLAIIQEAGGNVYVYPNASGTPTIYGDTGVLYSEGVTYDNSGNLFISVTYDNHYHSSGFIVLPQDSTTFEKITIQGSNDDDFGGQLAWDGKYLAIGSEQAARKRRLNTEVVYRVQISGSTGTVVGKVPLAQQKVPFHPQYIIHNGTAIDEYDGHKSSYFAYFKYPGGKETKEVKVSGETGIVGAALSIAPSGARIRK